jgi:hypothetical protein
MHYFIIEQYNGELKKAYIFDTSEELVLFVNQKHPILAAEIRSIVMRHGYEKGGNLYKIPTKCPDSVAIGWS